MKDGRDDARPRLKTVFEHSDEWIKCSDQKPTTNNAVLISNGIDIDIGRYCCQCDIFESRYEGSPILEAKWWKLFPNLPEDA